jgi:predicted Zn-dependent protease
MPNPFKPVFLIIAVFFATCPQPVQAVPFVTLETEIAMGKEADGAIINQFGLYQDKSLQLYVNNIGQRLVSQLSDKIFPKYYFRVMDSPDINAFALPGGYVYVTRGLLALVNSEAELAGVIGHEIGHIIFHHGAKQMVRNIGAQIFAIGGAIANPENAGGWLTVSTALFQQINLGYGREAEIESDEHGILSGSEAGYNAYGMAKFLKSLRRKEIMSGQSYHSFQASHPETKDRIIHAGLLAGRMKGDSTEENLFRSRFLNQIRGLIYEGKKHPKDAKRYKPKYIDIYEVKKGDTFQSIAIKELGDKRKDLGLTVLNGRRESSQPKPGELIKIIRPGKFKKNKTLKLESYSELNATPNK